MTERSVEAFARDDWFLLAEEPDGDRNVKETGRWVATRDPVEVRQ